MLTADLDPTDFGRMLAPLTSLWGDRVHSFYQVAGAIMIIAGTAIFKPVGSAMVVAARGEQRVGDGGSAPILVDGWGADPWGLPQFVNDRIAPIGR